LLQVLEHSVQPIAQLGLHVATHGICQLRVHRLPGQRTQPSLGSEPERFIHQDCGDPAGGDRLVDD
jgi:hypothetical protein